jgi:hypothetical protein
LCFCRGWVRVVARGGDLFGRMFVLLRFWLNFCLGSPLPMSLAVPMESVLTTGRRTIRGPPAPTLDQPGWSCCLLWRLVVLRCALQLRGDLPGLRTLGSRVAATGSHSRIDYIFFDTQRRLHLLRHPASTTISSASIVWSLRTPGTQRHPQGLWRRSQVMIFFP